MKSERRMLSRYWGSDKKSTLWRAAVLIAIVAITDWRVDLNIAFGFLYLFPMLLAGSVLSRWQVTAVAFLCTILSDRFDPFPFSVSVGLPQDILVFSALCGTGLFAHETARNARREREDRKKIETEAAARREAEEQLEFLIENSPAAILTMDAAGLILSANPAAHTLFAVPAGELRGKYVSRYITALGRVLDVSHAYVFRTEMQCRGEKSNGDVFLANVFFSTYQTRTGPRLAALVVDASEELRDREEASRQQLLAGSRILASAVAHEVRNVCAAISVAYENLARAGAVGDNSDFAALGALVEALHKIASFDLKKSSSSLEISAVDLRDVLQNLRIVLESSCQDNGITVIWDLPEGLPAVWADRHSLMQVFLNLTNNSERAMQNASVKNLTISAAEQEGKIQVTVRDTGPGVRDPQRLFQPFQSGTDSSGLGLYVSRAFMRLFQGDVRYEPVENGCAFILELAIAGDPEQRKMSRENSPAEVELN